jgi:Tfp pilus assembly protein PilV
MGEARAFTLLEVLISAALITLTLGGIVTMNARAAAGLQTSRITAAGSLVLQERIEMVRQSAWSQVAGSDALLALMQTPTPSEAELGSAFVAEVMTVTVPTETSTGLQETAQTFSVRRSGGIVSVSQSGDFSTAPTLLFQGNLTWRDKNLVHQRSLRTVVCSSGLTRCGIVGTALGRPGSLSSSP